MRGHCVLLNTMAETSKRAKRFGSGYEFQCLVPASMSRLVLFVTVPATTPAAVVANCRAAHAFACSGVWLVPGEGDLALCARAASVALPPDFVVGVAPDEPLGQQAAWMHRHCPAAAAVWSRGTVTICQALKLQDQPGGWKRGRAK